MATEGLTVHHQDEIKKFLKFFRGKLELHLSALESDFDDTRTDRLSTEDMYTQEEVAEVMESLCNAIKSSVRSEFQSSTNMTALLLRQLYSQADEECVELTADISIVENSSLLEKVQRIRVDDPSQYEATATRQRRANSKIDTLTSENEALQAKLETLRGAQEDLSDQMNKHLETTRVLELENKQLRRRQKDKEVDAGEEGAKVHALEKELKSTQRKLNAVHQLPEDVPGSITSSKPYLLMRETLSKKNDLLRTLRAKLLTYEPDMSSYATDDEEGKDALGDLEDLSMQPPMSASSRK